MKYGEKYGDFCTEIEWRSEDLLEKMNATEIKDHPLSIRKQLGLLIGILQQLDLILPIK